MKKLQKFSFSDEMEGHYGMLKYILVLQDMSSATGSRGQ